MATIKAQIELDVTDEQFSEAVERTLKNNPDFVLVVRCKDCKYWEHMEDGMGDCTNGAFHLDGHPDPTMAFNDYCSRGERRTDND